MSKLKYGIIEVTTKCQLRCEGCYMVQKDALNGKGMSLNQAVAVLDACRDYTGKELESMDILGGEPLLWPHLKTYIEILLQRGIQPWIFTNMLAINFDLAVWLRRRGVYITGKMNVNPNQEQLWPVQAKLIGGKEKQVKRMIEAVNIFLQAGYKSPMFKLENLVRRDNVDYIPDFYRWCLEQNIDPDVELLGCGDGLTEEYWEYGPTPRRLAEMIRGIQKVRREMGLPEPEVVMPHVFSPCRFFESGLYFGCDGHIRACSNSRKILATMSDQNPVAKAWESELFQCRHSLSQDKMDGPCGTCDRWERCKGGCRATSEGSGNPFGGYELCPVRFL